MEIKIYVKKISFLPILKKIDSPKAVKIGKKVKKKT